jgi:hypothetical protein
MDYALAHGDSFEYLEKVGETKNAFTLDYFFSLQYYV